jgi:hypothetical protein
VATFFARHLPLITRHCFVGHGQATITMGWTRKKSNNTPCISIMFICRSRIADDRKAHDTKSVSWLPATRFKAEVSACLIWNRVGAIFQLMDRAVEEDGRSPARI